MPRLSYSLGAADSTTVIVAVAVDVGALCALVTNAVNELDKCEYHTVPTLQM